MPRCLRSRRTIASLLAGLLTILSAVSCGPIGELLGPDNETQPTNQAGSPSPRPPRPTGTIAVGPTTVVASQVLGQDGGSITVSNPGAPLDGLTLTVPEGAYSTSFQVNVSFAPVSGHSFGEHFNPATPLISIDNGARFAEEFMTLRIPVDVPDDHFAMAFYYDEASGTLEGIPFNAVDSASITIVTRHFSKLLVSVIKNSVLEDLIENDVDSHFRPGIDDWQFTNYGSYVADGGHCAGQCLTALWYFCEEPDGKDLTLHGRYDRNGEKPATPDLWEDDSRGYRLASTIQKDIRWASFENKFMTSLAGVDDALTFKAFAYAIRLTGEPQEIGIFSAAGGHDMICYRLYKDTLYVADPNYPGRTDRRVEFVNGRFKPYESGANAAQIAAGNSISFNIFMYCAKSATIDWKKLEERWAEFKAGTIGDDRFPQYSIILTHSDGATEPLTDGYESKSPSVRINIDSTVPTAIRVSRDGASVARDATGAYPLKEGNNLIGISVWADVNNNPQSRQWEYVDFQYFNVSYGPKETTGCKGWALESVTPDWAPKEKKWGDQYETDYVFSATDGAFSSSGRMWLGTETAQGAGSLEAWVLFSHRGTWTPLPPCIPLGETTTITLNLDSPVVGIDGTPAHDRGWAASYSHLWVNINDGEGLYLDDSDKLESASTTSQGSTESLVIQFNLTELAYGRPEEGAVMEVAVWFGTLNGGGCYRYKYVYRG